MRINFFNSESSLYPFRWFVIVAAGFVILLGYSNYTGLRLFTFNSQQQWSASGPGGHK